MEIAKTVFVHAYWRFRLGKWEYVRAHWCRPPRRRRKNYLRLCAFSDDAISLQLNCKFIDCISK